ncbi:MAG: hypothetical protein NXH97_02305 [Rhodobacteraceae bacterium]|nr:hypothetical protein [Paracoccaceae bacterium]
MRLIFVVLILCLIGGPIAFAAASLQPDPILPSSATLTPRQAVQSKALIKRARDVADGTDPAGRIEATEAELNALIATAARVVKPLLGATEIDESGLRVRVAAQIPGVPQLGWVNIDAKAAPSQNGLEVTSLRLGRMTLPTRTTVSLATGALDLATPDDLGSLLLTSITALDTRDGIAVLTLNAGGAGDASLLSQVKSQLRGAAGRPTTAEVKAHFAAMSAAARDGALPRDGSAAPWIAFAMERVAEAGHVSAEEKQFDTRAALIALAAHCGDGAAIGLIVGNLQDEPGFKPCDDTDLAGRKDLRKHFTLSAGLQSISGSAMSFGMGEVKELLDTGSEGGSGFSFDDIAADRAGIRYAETFNAVSPEDLGPLVAQISGEADIMPSINGLPSQLSESAFLEQYGEAGSPAYNRQIAEIDQRIDALTLYR